MGVPVRFQTDDQRALDVIAASYRAWRAFPVPNQTPIEVIVQVGELQGDALNHVTVSEPRLSLAADGIVGQADAGIGRAHCTIAPELFGLGSVEESLDALVLFLVTAQERIPLHAAGILIDDSAALTSGGSGAGKSTLAAAALANGHQILSDDAVYVEPGKTSRFWGFPRPVHLPADFADDDALLRRGKLKRRLPYEAGLTTGPVTQAGLFLLQHGAAARIDEISANEATAHLLNTLAPGFDRFRVDVPRVVDAITQGYWMLTLSHEPTDAIALIADVLA